MARLTNAGVELGLCVSRGNSFAQKQREGRFFYGFASFAPSPLDHPRQPLDTGQSLAHQTKLPDRNEFSNLNRQVYSSSGRSRSFSWEVCQW